jgi:hypothetical protein
MAENSDKAAAGDRAMAKIIAGEDYTTVIAEMEAKWINAAEEAVFNN